MIDTEYAALRWVRDVLPPSERWPIEASSLPSRSNNVVYAVRAANGARYILKIIAAGRVHAFAHERAVTDYLAERGFPVPRVIAATALRETRDLATLRSWLPGEPAGAWCAAADTAGRGGLIDAFAALLARVHHLPLDEVRGLWQFPEDCVMHPPEWATNFVQKKIASDLDRITVALPETVRATFAAEVTAWGQRLAAAPVSLAPLHGDYYWDNVLVDDGTVTGILDWEAARLGDPLWDIARTQVAAFGEAPDAFARFLLAYATRVPWAVDVPRIRRYRLLMAMGDLRYAVRHASALIPERLPAVIDLWRTCVDIGD